MSRQVLETTANPAGQILEHEKVNRNSNYCNELVIIIITRWQKCMISVSMSGYVLRNVNNSGLLRSNLDIIELWSWEVQLKFVFFFYRLFKELS